MVSACLRPCLYTCIILYQGFIPDILMTDIHVWFGAVVRTTGTAGTLPLICSVNFGLYSIFSGVCRFLWLTADNDYCIVIIVLCQ